jgi:hypothetical protein
MTFPRVDNASGLEQLIREADFADGVLVILCRHTTKHNPGGRSWVVDIEVMIMIGYTDFLPSPTMDKGSRTEYILLAGDSVDFWFISSCRIDT